MVPHVPRVGEPRDPKGVADKTQRAGVEARQRMKARARGEGGRLSQKCRKKVEEVFGWAMGVAGAGRSRLAGRWNLRQTPELVAASTVWSARVTRRRRWNLRQTPELVAAAYNPGLPLTPGRPAERQTPELVAAVYNLVRLRKLAPAG